ncbi:alpha/beta hydrolase [Inconstantimicrobium porci]|uniref:Lysophospholipase n=1 Tax=Inconstantimicrobium porci TaxID=2652291 RepID=A0A7X2MX47_9CLOT|nr:alpha/beta hydrolase [Inconstantimicrobium porci]MSR90694.1 lysophospholipase [Inconstantimicrobium porci]
MKVEFTFKDKENKSIRGYKWTLDNSKIPKAVVQISHGMVETISRYDYFAEKLNEAGYIVYGHEHRGHGKVAEENNELGYLGESGFSALVENVHDVTDIIKKEYPGVPVILFGHSMGSFVSQRYIQLYGDEIKAVILSGTNGKPPFGTSLGILLSGLECKIRGAKHTSNFIDKLCFGNYNKKIKEKRTAVDWLSRDTQQVDKYLNDRLCGFVCSASFYNELFKALKKNVKKENVNKVPKNLPIYIFAGDCDPVGNYGKGILNLYGIYKKADVKDVSYKLYNGGRHEMLNEINRDEVISDIIDKLNDFSRN